jgi:hypothetical protein
LAAGNDIKNEQSTTANDDSGQWRQTTAANNSSDRNGSTTMSETEITHLEQAHNQHARTGKQSTCKPRHPEAHATHTETECAASM